MLIYCPAIIINMNKQQNGKKEPTVLFPTLRQPNITTSSVQFKTIQPPSLQTLKIFQKFKFPDYKLTSAFRIFQQEEDMKVKETVIRRNRGNYKKYTVAEKQQAVKELIKGNDPKSVSQKYGIPRRNLLRWKKNGCQRKDSTRSAGMEMQVVLYHLIDQKIITTEMQIRTQAKRLCKIEDFQASKGWFCKFSRRYSQWKQQQQRPKNALTQQQSQGNQGKQKEQKEFPSLYDIESGSEDENDYGSVETDKIE